MGSGEPYFFDFTSECTYFSSLKNYICILYIVDLTMEVIMLVEVAQNGEGSLSLFKQFTIRLKILGNKVITFL
jgi:hypothetical protein